MNTAENKEKILVAMSGGVDSSSALLMLLDEGYSCVGVTFKFHSGFSVAEAEDAKNICDTFEVKHIFVDMREEFEKEVVSHFVKTYAEGKTPNPCAVCNRKVKFKALIEIAEKEGCVKIATGHYAKTKEENGRIHLYKSTDKLKDQGYFLSTLSQETLRKIIFPLAGTTKKENREYLKKKGVVSHEKGESQEACFIDERGYAALVEEKIGKFESGNIINIKSGEKLGEHKGIMNYTIGQRRGIGIAYKQPLYVCKIDASKNIVYVGTKEDKFSSSFTVSSLNEINPLTFPWEGSVKVRYQSEESPCKVYEESGKITVEYIDTKRTVCPGQLAVFYQNDEILASAFIE